MRDGRQACRRAGTYPIGEALGQVTTVFPFSRLESGVQAASCEWSIQTVYSRSAAAVCVAPAIPVNRDIPLPSWEGSSDLFDGCARLRHKIRRKVEEMEDELINIEWA